MSTPSQRLDSCKYISFSGAGSLGAAYIGVIQALHEMMPPGATCSFKKFLSEIRGFSGTSIGSLCSLMLLLQIDTARIEAIALKLLNSMYHPDMDFSSLLSSYGIEKGAALKNIVCETLNEGGLAKDITFQDLYRLTSKEYVCVATNLTSKKPVYFSHTNTPETKICDAVYMSMCIPFLFVPIRHNDDICVDGCLTHCMPDAFSRNLTLFIDTETISMPTRIESIRDYFFSIFSFSIDNPSDWTMNEKNCICMKFLSTEENSFANLAISERVYRDRVRIGFVTTCAYLFPEVATTIETIFRLLLDGHLARSKQSSGFDDDIETCSACESVAEGDQYR